jgi:hypothetical protein
VYKIKKTLFLYAFMVNLFVSGSGYTVAGTWTTLDMPGAYRTYALGINGSNIVGVYDATYDASDQRGFLYNGLTWTTEIRAGDTWNGSAFTYLGMCMPGANVTISNAIDGSNVVGWYSDASDIVHGFIYNGSSWMTLDMPDASWTNPIRIDGSNIIGIYGNTSGVVHSFLYNGSTWTTIDMPGAQGTHAQSIDGSNIVGYYWMNGVQHGFLYNGSSWMTLDMPNASWTVAMGIDGNNVVGSYHSGTDSDSHGFIYTIPEPASLILLSLGGLLLRRKK